MDRDAVAAPAGRGEHTLQRLMDRSSPPAEPRHENLNLALNSWGRGDTMPADRSTFPRGGPDEETQREGTGMAGVGKIEGIVHMEEHLDQVGLAPLEAC